MKQFRIADERWDLSPAEHLARAEEILGEIPAPGDVAHVADVNQVVAERHILLARLDDAKTEHILMTRMNVVLSRLETMQR